jgi:hypothetical protein
VIGALSGLEPGLARFPCWEGERRRVMAQFSERMVTEVVQQFWTAMARGEFITDAAAEAGTYRVKGARWLRAEDGTLRPPES